MWTKLLSKSREHLNREYKIFRDENILFLVPFNLFSPYSILLISFIEKELRIGFWSTSKQSRRSYLGTHNLANYMISVFMEWLTHAQTPIWDLVSVSNQRSGLTPPGTKDLPCSCCPLNHLRCSEVTTIHDWNSLASYQPARFEGTAPRYKMWGFPL